ncbi:26S proteasome regulatory subunit [Cystobasidiomycetes sp. EMM_F5]
MDVDAAGSASEYLSTLASKAPSSLQPHIEALQRYSDRKLWHQLANSLQAILRMPESGPFQIELFDGFISRYTKRLDQLRLVEMAVTVAQQYEDGNAALEFLRSIETTVNKPETVEAHLLCTTEAAHFSLLLGDLAAVQTTLTAASKTLDTLDNVPSIVHAAFYRVSGDLHKSKAEYGGYYKNSLLYLACVDDLERDLTKEERIGRAHDLGIAALLGPSIYNFGELLMHPILKELLGTQHEWLHSLLYAFNAGSLGKFESLLPYFDQEASLGMPILASSIDFLRPKICLMSLIDLVFRLPSSQRVAIPFSHIASSTQLRSEEVEFLIMKALSLSLIRGSIDQIDQTARITWVQPRVLGKEQIDELRVRLDDWSTKVLDVGTKAVSGAQELMVQ